MNTTEIEHMEVFKVKNVKNFTIGFINIFRLTKMVYHEHSDDDHFELLVTSLKNPEYDTAIVDIFVVILILCCIGVGAGYYHYRKRMGFKTYLINNANDPFSS